MSDVFFQKAHQHNKKLITVKTEQNDNRYIMSTLKKSIYHKYKNHIMNEIERKFLRFDCINQMKTIYFPLLGRQVLNESNSRRYRNREDAMTAKNIKTEMYILL